MIDWIKKLFKTIGHLLAGIWSFLGNFFTGVATITKNTVDIEDAVIELGRNLKVQLDRLEHFKFEPRWKSRVINVPVAIDQIRAFIHLITDDWRDRIDTIRKPISGLQAVIEGLHHGGVSGGGDQEALSGLSKAELISSAIVTFTDDLAGAFNEINEFEDIFRQVIDQIEGLDALFLQQGNPKRIVDEHYAKRQRS
jgi:hypothetical protein